MTTTRTSKRRKQPARPAVTSADGRHLHAVIDDELYQGVKEHACKLEGVPFTRKQDRMNLSASVRDLLRIALGMRAAA